MMQFSQMQKCSLYLEIRTVFCINSCDHNYIHSTLKFLFMQTITLLSSLLGESAYKEKI
jgi:hypothetical protein